MELVTARTEGNFLYLMPHGRIDTGNAADAQAAFEKEIAANPGLDVILDAEDLQYISSAGLRVVLRLKKDYPSFQVQNVSTDVYEIFDMTGFTEMIPIRRAFRKLSVEGCQVIGRGAKGTVYRYDPEIVVKAYHNPDSLPDILRERELARKAFVLGVPTAISYDVVKIDDSYGSVFELLDARTFSQCITEDMENFDRYIREFADLLHQINTTAVSPDDMPDQRPVVEKWISYSEKYLTADEFRKVRGLMDAIPTVYTMVHGDYHSNNLLMQNGEPVLIDMDTLSYGHPIFELANVFFTYYGFTQIDPNNVSDFLGMSPEVAMRVWEKFLPVYLGTEDKTRIAEVNDKVSLLGYLRILRFIGRRDASPEQMELCLDKIRTLLQGIDNLNFEI